MRLQMNSEYKSLKTHEELGLDPLYYELKPSSSRDGYAYFCSTCGSELYIHFMDTHVVARKYTDKEKASLPEGWKEKIAIAQKECDYNFGKYGFALVNQYKKTVEREMWWKNKTCPVCGSLLDKKTAGYGKKIHVFDTFGRKEVDFDFIFSEMEQLRIPQEREIAKKEAIEFINNVKYEYIPKENKCNIDKLDLKEYLLNLIKIETNMQSLKGRIEELLYRKIEIHRGVVGENYSIAYELKTQLENARKQYNESLNKLETLEHQISTGNYTGVCFSRDVPVKPIEPKEPKYATPSIFNKKRILQENDTLRKKYETEISLYNNALIQYNQQLKMYISEREEYAKKQVELYRQECNEKDSILRELQNQYDSQINSDSNEIPNSATANKLILDEEISLAKNLYIELFKCREDLYNNNIIFGKYRTFPAVTTFYEYLLAGRCEQLEGVAGAYNLYEQELRANTIIGNLSEIITSLEKIRNTQYVIYSEIHSMNETLKRMDQKLTEATNSIKMIEAHTENMAEYLEHISKNSDVIAYNTAKTAYYSQMNAELTNALGYMVAMN